MGKRYNKAGKAGQRQSPLLTNPLGADIPGDGDTGGGSGPRQHRRTHSRGGQFNFDQQRRGTSGPGSQSGRGRNQTSGRDHVMTINLNVSGSIRSSYIPNFDYRDEVRISMWCLFKFFFLFVGYWPTYIRLSK